MECLTAILVVGLLAQQASCQGLGNNPMVMAYLASQGGGAGGALNPALMGGMAGAEMQDLMLLNALQRSNAAGGNPGASGGANNMQMDPTAFMLMNQAGGMSQDMLQNMWMMNALRQNNPDQQGAHGRQAAPGQGQYKQQRNVKREILEMLIFSNENVQPLSPIRLMDPSHKLALIRDGLTVSADVRRQIQMFFPQQCPPPPLHFCENPMYKEETNYVCPVCLFGPMGGAGSMLGGVMASMGAGAAMPGIGAGGAMPGMGANMGSSMPGAGDPVMAALLSGQSGSNLPPAALMGLLQQSQAQTKAPAPQPTQETSVIPAGSLTPANPPPQVAVDYTPPVPAKKPARPSPPPGFGAMINAMKQQIDRMNLKLKTQGPKNPPPGPPPA